MQIRYWHKHGHRICVILDLNAINCEQVVKLISAHFAPGQTGLCAVRQTDVGSIAKY